MLGGRLTRLVWRVVVTYGGMAKQPLAVPPGLFIFKKLTLCVTEAVIRLFSHLWTELTLIEFCVILSRPLSSPSHPIRLAPSRRAGFWLSDWVKTHPKERLEMMNSLAQLMADGKLKAPETDEVDLAGLGGDEVGAAVRGVMEKQEQGKTGKKVLLKFS